MTPRGMDTSPINILLTSAGRRNYLIQLFKEALGGRGKLIACDSCASAAALVEADEKVILPSADQPEYTDALTAICREHNVRLIFSLNDLEVTRLAARASYLRAMGSIAVVSSPQVVATCLDKWATFTFLRAHDIPTPNTYRTVADARDALRMGAIRFPLLVKPRWGSGSIGVEYVENDRELELAYEWGKTRIKQTILTRMLDHDPEDCLIIQEQLRGQEYGIDIVNDLAGRHICTFGRLKMAMRCGETERAMTIRDATLDTLGRRIAQHLGHLGIVDGDVIVTDKGPHVLDLNPRFGGGYPFSHLAGANLPAAFIAWAGGEEADPAWFDVRPGFVASKCDRLVLIEQQQHSDNRNTTRLTPPMNYGVTAPLNSSEAL